jgi:hypothetical protein
VATEIVVKVPEMKGLDQGGGEWLPWFWQSRVTGHAYNLKMKAFKDTVQRDGPG